MQPEIKDDYNRFPAKASISFQENFLNKAVVDEYIEMFFDLIKKIKPDLVIKRKKFKIIVSHDVDYFLLNYKFPIKNLLGDLYKRKNIKLFLNRISIFYNTFINYKKDPYWMFDYFIRKEKNGVSSVFFFLMDKIPENNYNIKDRRLIELIRNLQNKKIEIGLHGSFLSSNNKDYLKKEKELLEIIIGEKKYGVRQHFLGFNVKKTWKIQNDLGFKYDTSCGFPDYEGFRCGTCHPFKIYDLENDCVLDLVEIPLIVMDGTLRDYQKYSPIKAIEVIQNLKKTCKKHDGVFTILWHNSFFYNNEEWKEVYEESIKLI